MGKRNIESPAHRRETAKALWFLFRVFGSMTAVCIALVVGPSLLADRYDARHPPVWVECTVTDAEGGMGRARFSAPWPRVLIHTSDCGTLTLANGIDESTMEAVADDLVPGGKFSFEVLASTKAAWKIKEFLRQTPHPVLSFRKAG